MSMAVFRASFKNVIEVGQLILGVRAGEMEGIIVSQVFEYPVAHLFYHLHVVAIGGDYQCSQFKSDALVFQDLEGPEDRFQPSRIEAGIDRFGETLHIDICRIEGPGKFPKGGATKIPLSIRHCAAKRFETVLPAGHHQCQR